MDLWHLQFYKTWGKKNLSFYPKPDTEKDNGAGINSINRKVGLEVLCFCICGRQWHEESEQT